MTLLVIVPVFFLSVLTGAALGLARLKPLAPLVLMVVANVLVGLGMYSNHQSGWHIAAVIAIIFFAVYMGYFLGVARTPPGKSKKRRKGPLFIVR